MTSRISNSLASNPWLLNVWALFAAFSTYFFMYMFRKPFTAAAYENEAGDYWHSKSLIVSAQVLGYLCSKLMGIHVISQMSKSKRAWVLFGLIAASHSALLLFAIVPGPGHAIAIFLNGLCLGLVFGLVLGFLEGRRTTEALVAGLCASFIVAGGFSKTLGQWTLLLLTERMALNLQVAERWMPFVAAAFFLIPIAITTWMLSQIPPPSIQDEAVRSKRTPMTYRDRLTMLRQYGIGLSGIAILYLLVTVLRSLRDDFAPQILYGMGAKVEPAQYAWIDTQVAFIVLVANGLASLFRGHRSALQFAVVISFCGLGLISIALIYSEQFTPIIFMVSIGAGLYLPYVAVHTTVFERLIALTRDRGNITFLMYLVDSLGYLGYVLVLFVPKGKLFGSETADVSFYMAFRWYCWLAVAVGAAAGLLAFIHFSLLRSHRHESSPPVKT